MIRIATQVIGADALSARFRQRAATASAKLGPALLEAGALVQSEAQRLVADPPKTGRIYTTEFWTDKAGRVRPGRARVPHQASAPGEAPATDTGNLISSIVLDGTDLPRGEITIAAQAKYARFLELGTARMAARPFLRRALDTMRGRVLTLIRRALA